MSRKGEVIEIQNGFSIILVLAIIAITGMTVVGTLAIAHLQENQEPLCDRYRNRELRTVPARCLNYFQKESN